MGDCDWRWHLMLSFNFLLKFISETHLCAAWLKCDQQFNSMRANPIQFNPKVIRYDPMRSVVARSRLASVKYFGLFAVGCLS